MKNITERYVFLTDKIRIDTDAITHSIVPKEELMWKRTCSFSSIEEALKFYIKTELNNSSNIEEMSQKVKKIMKKIDEFLEIKKKKEEKKCNKRERTNSKKIIGFGF